VTDFFEFMLTDAGPPDKPQTINSMLARSESLLKNEHAGNPSSRRRSCSRRRPTSSPSATRRRPRPSWRRILALLRDSDAGGIRAEASCLHGFAVSMRGDADAGAREIEATLREPGLPANAAASCHQHMAFIAENKGDGRGGAAQRAGRPRRAEDRGASPAAPAGLAARRPGLRRSSCKGRNDSADRLYTEALAKLTAMGRDRTRSRSGIQNNWAIASIGAGDIKRALALYEQSARTLRERDPDAPLPGYLAATWRGRSS
jgi:hypothetical protein